MHEKVSRALGPRLALTILAALSLPMLGAGPAAAQAEAEAGGTPAAAEGAADDKPKQRLGVLAEQAEDDGREWLVDETDGRRYRIERVAKVPGSYRFISEDTVRFAGGAYLDVVEQDDEFLWVKAYEAFTTVKKRPPQPRKGPTDEEIAAVAATYAPEAKPVDRLKLNAFDKGLPRRGQWRNGFDIGDINEDGHLDIVFGPARKGRPLPNVFLGDSSGNWQPWRQARFPQGPYDYGDVALGDYNGDGHLDMAFGIHLRGLYLIVGDGKGGFTPWNKGIAYDVPGQGGDATSFSSRSIEAIDWNADGKLDVLALGEGPKGRKSKTNTVTGELINTSRGFLVYLNQGDGTWKPSGLERVPTPQANFADDFAVGDVDGDGETDLITGTRRMGSQQIFAIRQDDDGIVYEALEILRPNAFIDTVDAADWDGDGRDDVAVGYRNREMGTWRSGVDVYFQKQEGWERRALFSIENRQGVFSVANGDIDGDGSLDLVAVTGQAEMKVFLGTGGGQFEAEDSPELSELEAPGCKAFQVRLVDIDDDGAAEVVAAFAGEEVGFPGLARLSKPGCPDQGSLRVWQTQAVKN
ncbi:MAG: VCBS repeat-containing protein [Acidobacteriota bacterium]